MMTDDWIIPDAGAIPHPLRSAAIARPDHCALVADDGEWTYGALCDRVASEAARLTALGIEPGMCVVLSGVASSAWIVAFHALGWIGATVAPLAHDAPEAELRRDLATIAPAAVVLTQGAPETLATHAKVIRFELAAVAADAPRAPERFWPWGETRLVLLTSGTTGTPRPVPLTTQQLALQAFGSAIRLEHRAGDRWLACLPLHHVGGLSVLTRCAFYATTVVLHARFVAARVARALDLGQATMVSLVPTMLERVLDVRDAKPFPASLRVALIGGAKAPPDLVARCRALEVPVALTWGMSEAASQVATRMVGDTSPESGAGAPLAFARVRVNDGLLEIAGPTVGGVFISRDRGGIDAQGRVHIHGRDDGVIVSGGEKIDPLELERVLAEHPQVRDACVLGVPSPRWGERPVAMLVARAKPAEDADLDAWCAKSLSRFKTPDHYVWVDSLATSAMDKRSRAALTEVLRSRAPELFVTSDANAPQRVRESGGEADRAEGAKVDEGMHCGSRGAQHFVLPNDAVADGDGLLAHRRDRHLDAQALTQAHGLLEVGLGVHQRRAPLFGLEESLDAARRHGKKLFESLVAVLEYPRKEDDTGAIDVAKTDSEPMFESQSRTPKAEEDV